jgi:hypothetical protein
MTQREESVGKTRKSLDQIKTVSRLIDNNLIKQRNCTGQFGSIRSNYSSDTEGRKEAKAPKIQKFMPFPYEAEFLGGCDMSADSSIVMISPQMSKLSISSMSPTGSVRSLRGFPSLNNNKNFLSPQQQPKLHHAHSMPDLHAISNSNAPYLFAKLSPDIQQRASSFQLNIDYLSKVEEMGTQENSRQRKSSFNRRLSERSSNGGSISGSVLNLDIFCANNNSPTSSVFDGDSKAMNNDDDVVDILIHVPNFNFEAAPKNDHNF